MLEAQVATTETRRLRIAVLNRNFAPTAGGAERYAIALVEHLAQRHEVHVYAQHTVHDWPGVTYHRVSMPWRKPRWLNQLWYATATWWATRQGFDVVHSHENTWHGQVQTVHVLPVWHNLFHGRQGWRWGVRWLQVVTSPRLMTYLWLEHRRFGGVGGQARRSIMVTSDSLREVMARTFPRAVDALRVLVPGVSVPERSSPDQRQVQQRAARVALGLPPQGLCLLLVGNDFRKKGLGCALQALASLPPDVVLAVVGNPQQQAIFQAEAERLGLRSRVFFVGQMDDVSAAYVAADVLVHPTLEDTFAMVVLEAMAHSLPVVVSGAAHCGIAGLLQDGRDAIVLPDPKDAAALAGHLRRLWAEPALREQLGQAGRRFAEQHAWPEKARLQESIYLALIR